MKKFPDVVNNEEKKQFEIEIDGFKGIIQYIKSTRKIYLIHTEVPDELEGQGIGSHLVEKTLEWIESNGLKVVPLCPFVKKYIDENPEWQKLVAPNKK